MLTLSLRRFIFFTTPGYVCRTISTGLADQAAGSTVDSDDTIAVHATPGQALRWARTRVTKMAPVMDKASVLMASDWLADLDGFYITRGALHRGEAFVMSLDTHHRRVVLEIARVRLLPVLDPCTCSATSRL